MENVSHYNSTANTSTNQLQFYHCSLLGDVFQWQNEYLTASVYTSSLLGAIASSFLFPFTTLANIFVLVAFLKARTLRLNRTNMIMSSLSITDLIVGIIVHPFFVICRISEIVGSEKWVCIGRYVYKTAAVLCVGSSVGHLTFISIERLIVSIRPNRHRQILSMARSWTVIVFIWSYCIAGCVAVSPLVEALPKRELITRASYITVSIVITLSCYVWIFNGMGRQRQRQIGQQTCPTRNITNNMLSHKETRVAKTMAYTCLAFFLFCLPEVIGNAMVASGKFDENTMVYIVFNWTQLLAFSNSLFNPVWYSFKMPVVRTAVNRYIRTFRK